MLPPVFQTLKASAAVKGFVGTQTPRIFRFGNAPQNVPTPYITWLLVSGVPENNLSDPPPVDRQTVQIDCWHETDAGCDALGDAVRDALELVTHVTAYENMPLDPETKRYRISIDADFWGR